MENNNLELYNQVRNVPDNAKKEIKDGRLKGMTDINPMWRIKTLTEQFGVCGFGWKTEIIRTWLDNGSNNEIIANVEIKLYVKINEIWSDAIPGIGGSTLISKEKTGLYTDDECYKKAYTDALSVACKALGIGADVYFEKDKTKYDTQNKMETNKEDALNKLSREELFVEVAALKIDIDRLVKFFKVETADNLTDEQIRQGIRLKMSHKK